VLNALSPVLSPALVKDLGLPELHRRLAERFDLEVSYDACRVFQHSPGKDWHFPLKFPKMGTDNSECTVPLKKVCPFATTLGGVK
jgi:hypothetical protein